MAPASKGALLNIHYCYYYYNNLHNSIEETYSKIHNQDPKLYTI